MNSSTAQITIRLAYADDQLTLLRLAALDSAPVVSASRSARLNTRPGVSAVLRKSHQ